MYKHVLKPLLSSILPLSQNRSHHQEQRQCGRALQSPLTTDADAICWPNSRVKITTYFLLPTSSSNPGLLLFSTWFTFTQWVMLFLTSCLSHRLHLINHKLLLILPYQYLLNLLCDFHLHYHYCKWNLFHFLSIAKIIFELASPSQTWLLKSGIQTGTT